MCYARYLRSLVLNDINRSDLQHTCARTANPRSSALMMSSKSENRVSLSVSIFWMLASNSPFLYADSISLRCHMLAMTARRHIMADVWHGAAL
jgi:hypothetical protein